MPWRIEKRNGKHCVIKEDTGESSGCHPTRQEAVAQMRALYASESGRREGKALGESEAPMEDIITDKATWDTAYVNGLPDSAFLHVESGGEKDDEGKTVPRSLRHLPYKDDSGTVDLPHLRNAISRLSQSATGGGSDGWLTDSLRKRLLSRARSILAKHQKSLFDRAVNWLKAAFGVEEPEPEPVNQFLVWKQADGEMRWLAIYSNRYRDRDHPPEILSEASHRDFVDAVEKGEWPYPSLRVWHVRGTDVGNADWLAYDDRGFSLASGTVRPEVGERLAALSDLGTSHGMPSKEIQRDEADPTVITRYRSAEISVLPAWAAANELTGFYAIPKETNDMAIPDEKKAFLEQVLPDGVLSDLEAALDAKAKAAEGMEFKEEPDTEPAPPEPEPEAELKEPEPEMVMEPAPAYVTQDEVAEAVGTLFGEITGRMDALAQVVDQITVQFKELTDQFRALQKDDEERIAKAAELTPAASLQAMMRQYSVVGKAGAKVDGRSELAKAKPAENTSVASNGPTVVPFLNELIRAQGAR